jgi:penicillin-binding protein 1A
MNAYVRIPLAVLAALTAGGIAVAALLIGGYFYVAPSLPKAEELRDVRLQIPLRVYSRDGRLMAEFGEQRRTPVSYERIPRTLIQALLAAEDDTFFEHPGLDFTGTGRAILSFLWAGGDRVAGGSTITQQVARESFLSRELSLVRKFKEWILAVQIEREFSKEEILELFFNTMFFGQKSYGVVAAAQTYFDKTLDQLTVSDAAIVVGLLQGPSILNPATSPRAAEVRRGYVLRRMRELNMISEAEYQQAVAEPVLATLYAPQTQLDAPFVAEMARAEMIRRFGPAAYTAGLKVTTTIDSRLQKAANLAIRQTLIGYDERHGYRGPLARVDLPGAHGGSEPADSGGGVDGPDAETVEAGLADVGDLNEWREVLGDYPPQSGLEAGLVLAADETSARVYLTSRGEERIGFDAVAWAGRYINDERKGAAPKSVAEVLQAGDIVRFRLDVNGNLRLAQIPEVEGAFVALDPQDGAITALAGGFDFQLSKYNRATQSKRQPGSAFKPFVWSAALEHGFTPATMVNDNPTNFGYDPELERVWKPENYGGRFHGDTRLREALVQSMNWVSIRVVHDVGARNTARHLRRFGFDDVALPQNLTLALGAGDLAPVELAGGLAVFANGGFRVQDYFVERIEDTSGVVLYEAMPAFACSDCGADGEQRDDASAQGAGSSDWRKTDTEPELIDDITELYPPIRLAPQAVSPQNAYLVADMMRDVVRRGTGAAAYRALQRNDLAGKTGTTNDERDAWFVGFNADVVAAARVGFDQPRSLGAGEQGGRTAIPMWISFMAEALDGRPEHAVERPPGIVDVRINPANGKVASDATRDSIFEQFEIGKIPEREADPVFSGPLDPASPNREPNRSEPIF